VTGARRSVLERIVDDLGRHYGPPVPPPVSDPLQMILWENVAYLADDEARAAAYALLERRVGTDPRAILAAPDEALLEVARAGGIMAERRPAKIRDVAEIVVAEFDGDLSRLVAGPLDKAKRGLRKFPGIGEPGAEKILLFARRQPILALDSNGLRVLSRLGFGEERKSYAATYRSVQEAASREIRADFDRLITTHLLLRRHGRTLCKTNAPVCERCPVRDHCRYFESRRTSADRVTRSRPAAGRPR
jgi:endonuclease-3